jgi:hypothetical protein
MRTPFFVLSFFGSLLFFAAPALADTATLTPVADSYTLNTYAGAATVFGSQDGMYAILGFGPSFARSYLRFDLSSIPAGATIQSAQLQLTVKSYSTTTLAQFSAQRVDAAWAEDTLTWNNQPSFSDTLETKSVNYGNPETWEMTTAVQNWIAGTWENNGLLIKSTEGAGTQSTRGYWTKEATNPSYVPTLTVTYVPPTAPAAPALTINTITTNANDTVATISFATNIAATGTVAYGTTTAYGSMRSDTAGLLHTITLNNLAPLTTYHFTVSATSDNESKTSADMTFTTTTSILQPPTCGLATGSLVKTADATAVYFIGSDCKRHAFPNANIYASWYTDFSQVTTISSAQMASFSLGPNVTYRPGIRMVKFQSLPKVYAVGPKGALRWISSEALAMELYGAEWNKKIDDVSDAFFTNYHYSADIITASDFVPTTATAATPSIDGNW